ncbi:MAG: DNA polymerase III subunit gamma/tau, partial [Candidatus Azambacteria bacterium]|nr:DNA polymerase III subunit gamma/tau [Candidatus Azambacteria bacterium]
MGNIVLYRKYRPQSWDEVIGQEHVVRTLTNALKLGRVSHAYLFSGPRGTGKTTIARLLAKSVGCVDLDLIEIDAASNRGIDEIRELRDGVKFAPTAGKYKVFIIDEVHQLTKEAFNALLKTLEEPPAHAIFILATTEVHKVPETILSRVQQFAFRRLTVAEIIKKLQKIVGAEKIKINDDALRLIASYAGGSFRDAESMLEQLRVWSDKIIAKEDIEELLGAVDFEKVKAMTDCLNNTGPKEAIDYVGALTEGGTDLEMFTKALVNHLRKIMLIKV